MLSEDPQEQANVSIVQAFIAAARRQPRDALRHARHTLAHAEVFGISFDYLRWAWPLAARAADELRDAAAAQANCSPCSTPASPGSWPPCCGPSATWSAPASPLGDGAQAAAAAFTAAITSLREQSTPYHLAHGLLDHAEYLDPPG